MRASRGDVGGRWREDGAMFDVEYSVREIAVQARDSGNETIEATAHDAACGD
jgi:hypothetical protein